MGYGKSVILRDCRYIVQQGGRDRVLREKKKNVHAWIIGYICDYVDQDKVLVSKVTYNPYKDKTFKADNKVISKSDYAFLSVYDDKYYVLAMNKEG